MRSIDARRCGRQGLARAAGMGVCAIALLLAGCASRSPPPAPTGASSAPPGASRPAPRTVPPPAETGAETPLPPRTKGPALPEPPVARNWVEFKRNAAQRLVAANPQQSYLGETPAELLGIPVIETELYVDGTIKSIRVVREPLNPQARDTVQLAIAAIRRAAPYGDMTRLTRPWKWVEVFLFDDKRHFKPQTLD